MNDYIKNSGLINHFSLFWKADEGMFIVPGEFLNDFWGAIDDVLETHPETRIKNIVNTISNSFTNIIQF